MLSVTEKKQYMAELKAMSGDSLYTMYMRAVAKYLEDGMTADDKFIFIADEVRDRLEIVHFIRTKIGTM